MSGCDCDRWDEATQSVVPDDRPHACGQQDNTERCDTCDAPSTGVVMTLFDTDDSGTLALCPTCADHWRLR